MKKIIFAILLFSLCIPKMQEFFNLINLRPLSGTIVQSEKPSFNIKNWFNGEFQNKYNKYKDENFGLRNFFIRSYNQIDYTLFNKTHGEVTIGKNGYLFQDNYIDEVTGASFIGDENMHTNIINIRNAENYLKNKNIFLLTVLAPGKTDYYKEYLPDYYSDKLINQRNYNSILKYASQENIHLIDFNKWILQMKDTSKYPLFPKQGIHWGYNCMALCADSIIKYIQVENKIPLQNISWSLEFPDELRGTDSDIGDLLNIFQKLSYNKMSYPKFNDIDTNKVRPRLLVIGDSFYWSIYHEGIYNKVFRNETFLYYCSSVNPSGRFPSDYVADLNFLKELENYDIIILLQSSGNYGNPGVNFIQTLMKELNRYDTFYKIEKNKIILNKNLLMNVKEIASKMNVTPDSAISFLSDSLTQNRLENISAIKIKMRHDPEWMKYLIEKSEQEKKSVDEVMQVDAEWTLDNEKK